ncbi:MAG: hypothetical protein RL208_221 [Pseudomonadota bacterium]
MNHYKNIRNIIISSFWIAHLAMKRDYGKTFGGFVWLAIKPLPQVVVICIMMKNVAGFASKINNYLLFVYSSLMTWNMILAVIVGAIMKFKSNGLLKRSLLTKQNIILSHIIYHLIIYIIMLIPVIVYNIFCLNFYILLLPIYIIIVCTILFCITYSIAIIICYIPDIASMIEIVMSLAFWATPVLYTLESVSGIMYYIMKYNPLYIIKQPISVITYYQTSPTLSLNISLLVLTFLSIFIYYFINTSKLDKNVVYYID